MSNLFPPRGSLPTADVVKRNLLKTVAVADRAALEGKHPFGSILQGNIDTVNHAELTLARRAFETLTPEELWKTTLYTNFEPCVMCTGAIYWANIGRIVYGAPETALLQLTGDHLENPTMAQSCRETLSKGSKDVEVIGPVPEVIEAVLDSHRTFWKEGA